MSAGPKLLSLTRLSWGLAAPVILLAAIGLVCIHVTDRGTQRNPSVGAPGEPRPADDGVLPRAYQAVGPLTARQFVYLIAGVGLVWLMIRPSYQVIGRYAYPLYALMIALLLVLVAGRLSERYGLGELPLVPAVRGTHRWIGIEELRIQPSEFMKVALVLALARYLRFRSSYRRWRGLIPPFLMTLAPMVLILFQPDLGTPLMLLPVLFIMLFVAGARLRHLLILVLLGCATLPVFYKYGMKDYQRMRFQVLLKQNTQDEAWHMDQGYQLRQAKIALGTGGVAGQGYGAGLFVQYDELLPEAQNDFIFAIIGHQWGLVGALLVLLAYAVIVLLGLEVATATNDPFGRLLAVGVIVMIVVQALLNICMPLGLAPITGMPLPFVSAGGSSLWANFIALGLLLNVAQRRPLLIAHPPFEYAEDE